MNHSFNGIIAIYKPQNMIGTDVDVPNLLRHTFGNVVPNLALSVYANIPGRYTKKIAPTPFIWPSTHSAVYVKYPKIPPY